MQQRLIFNRPRYMIGTSSSILKYTPVEQDDMIKFKDKIYRKPTIRRAKSRQTIPTKSLFYHTRARKRVDFLEFLHHRNVLRTKQKERQERSNMKLLVENVLFDCKDNTDSEKPRNHLNLNVGPKYRIRTVKSFDNLPFQVPDNNAVNKIPQEYDKLMQSINSDIVKDMHIKSQAGIFSREEILEHVQDMKDVFRNTTSK